MMISEFTRLIGGFEPTEAEYQEIEKAYMESDKSKQDFCNYFVRQGGIDRLVEERAKEISRLQGELAKQRAAYEEEISKKDSLISKLQKELDKELEWRYSDCGTSMGERDYRDMAACQITKALTIQEAKSLIHREFGFDPDMITILTEANTYEVNKYNQIRVKGTFKRQPLYASSDWNYIRFECAGWQYEMVNGELCNYNS